MAKSLGLRQTITDGGFYELMTVPYIKDKIRRPEIDTMSNMEKYLKHRNVSQQPLAGLDWKKCFEAKDQVAFQQLDVYAKKHIDDFCDIYNLKFPYNIEHKLENTARRAFYAGKAHYALQIFDEETKDFTQKKIYISKAHSGNAETSAL